MQLDAQRAHDAENRAKLRVAAGGKRLVEALAAKPGLSSNLRHALGTRDVSQGRSYDTRITVLECGFKVRDDVPVALQIVGRVPSLCFRLRHAVSLVLQALRQVVSGLDVASLALLVSAGEKNDQ
jgi:hypothetical protein